MIEAGQPQRYVTWEDFAPQAEAYPDAPPDAWICEEGWLIIGDEAWTPEEWATRKRWLTGRKIKYHDEKHVRDRERKRQRRTA